MGISRGRVYAAALEAVPLPANMTCEDDEVMTTWNRAASTPLCPSNDWDFQALRTEEKRATSSPRWHNRRRSIRARCSNRTSIGENCTLPLRRGGNQASRYVVPRSCKNTPFQTIATNCRAGKCAAAGEARLSKERMEKGVENFKGRH